MAALDIKPSLEDARKLFDQTCQASSTSTTSPRPTLLPICISLPADLLTPSAIYLKLSKGYASLPKHIPPSLYPVPNSSIDSLS